MLVTINTLTDGICVWCCRQTDEAVDVSFRDGLKGCLCKRHFWEALKARAGQKLPAGERPAGGGSAAKEKQS